jgi:N-acetylmuramic acid 6-phosphate etherase
VDASECPPTYGVPYGLVVGVIAGGDKAITTAVEFAEDDKEQGWKDLQYYNISDKDVVIGIAASGTTPYVISALEECRKHGIVTGSISCNPDSPLSAAADFPIEVIVGPEFVTGSTRMKSGTAQKLVLNMISTTAMIQLGRVEDNKMVNMQLTNEKLVDRGVKMLMQRLQLSDYEKAKQLLLEHGSVKKATESVDK